MKPRFISDIHLSKDSPHLTNAFKSFLDESKNACTHLFILGDLFEAWIGDDDEDLYHQEIKKILIDFTLGGPETFFMHGNRDFLIGKVFADEVGISILPDPYSLNINGLKAVCSHGDFLCTDDTDYIDFRNQVRSKKWQTDFLSKNIDERKSIASSLRTSSKEATSEKSLDITDVNIESVNGFIKENNPDIFIHGHTHRPGIHETKSCKRIVLGDWDKYGWYLAINEKNYDLKKFEI